MAEAGPASGHGRNFPAGQVGLVGQQDEPSGGISSVPRGTDASARPPSNAC